MAEKILNSYETIFIIDATLDEETVTALKDKFTTLIEQNGELESVDEWGKRRLAYEINDRTEGFYYLVNFKADSEFPKEDYRRYPKNYCYQKRRRIVFCEESGVSMNKVILMGRLTRDVEMRQTPNGVSLARFSIAVNRRFAGKDAQQQADFINCVAWRQTGEFIARYFQKGSMIAVVGSIQSRSWDGNDGKKQYATEVVVDEAYFTGSRAESGTQGGGNYQNQGFNQGGFNAPQSQPAQGSEPNFGDDFDMGDFSDLDGSEDDLPF